ncbi:DinI-like family protein [Enterobacter hormaechei]|uniref:DinI-like family protein n=1 Tax=Enterobacter hormaechei TaxID=158836 RepID=UPI0012B8F02A|nr:DinI-like family protein [Enterobacter hormaechei]MBT2053145.1 DinI-like family protein [Enterobacter hormaechei subsp. hoffmannii]MCU2452615.1 DinI family protein [Enterobacter hormaechei subsp. hoffmannii]MCW4743724.1 DinI family protein [Enterobacter hormaechei subsp. hoffmannii]
MNSGLTIECMKKNPDGALPVLESQLLIRLSKKFDDYQLTIRRVSHDGLAVFGGDKKEVEHIVQKTWESADEWFY